MKSVNLLEFLALPWSDKMRATLRAKVLESDEIQALSAQDNGGRLAVFAHTSVPDTWPAAVQVVWCRPPFVEPLDVKSKTQKAVDLVNEGMTPFAAAKEMGIHASAVYRAMTRADEKPLCPCCRQVLRDGFTVDTSVLKSQAGGTDAA